MIIQATMRDLPALESLYAAARERMRAAGNSDQWKDSYPPRTLIEEDIARGRLYLVKEDELLGAFVFFVGTEENYAAIDGLTQTSYTVPQGYHSGSGTVSLTGDIEEALAAI